MSQLGLYAEEEEEEYGKNEQIPLTVEEIVDENKDEAWLEEASAKGWESDSRRPQLAEIMSKSHDEFWTHQEAEHEWLFYVSLSDLNPRVAMVYLPDAITLMHAFKDIQQEMPFLTPKQRIKLDKLWDAAGVLKENLLSQLSKQWSGFLSPSTVEHTQLEQNYARRREEGPMDANDIVSFWDKELMQHAQQEERGFDAKEIENQDRQLILIDTYAEVEKTLKDRIDLYVNAVINTAMVQEQSDLKMASLQTRGFLRSLLPAALRRHEYRELLRGLGELMLIQQGLERPLTGREMMIGYNMSNRRHSRHQHQHNTKSKTPHYHYRRH
jgi:hypothetical protein